MKIRSIRIDKKFIPEWNQNKELPASEQVVIYFSRIPGASEKKNFVGWSTDGKGSITLSYNDVMMLTTFVQRIENLEIEVSGEIEKIKNGVDLASATCPGLSNLFDEIRGYLFPVDEDFEPGELKA